MADGAISVTAGIPVQHASLTPMISETEYGKIAQAVASLLSPTITAAVDRAVTAGIDQLRKGLRDHASRLLEAEHHISELEDDLQISQAAAHQASQTTRYILDKLDLENHSRRNNLLIIGLPETYDSSTLVDLCTTRIPKAWGSRLCAK